MKILGITGPTGAGKSTLTALLAAAGVPVYDCDVGAREVTKPGHPCLAELAAAFSPAILNADGSLNRAALAARAFSDPAAEKTLNAITHPYIIALADATCEGWAGQGFALAAVDAPLLFESGLDRQYDRTVAVLAPPEERLRRVMARDGLTEGQARLRMSAGQPDQFYLERADEILYNNGRKTDFIRDCEAAIWRWKAAFGEKKE